MNTADIVRAAKEIGDALSAAPRHWDGRGAIVEMRDSGYAHWRQTEWAGFYFQLQCERRLSDIAEMPGPRYGNTEFDAMHIIPWDFKMHATNTSSHRIIVNDREAIEGGINDHGSVGIVVAMGDVTYNDEQRTFQQWHDALKGGTSKYTQARIRRGAWSRFRKVTVDLQQISFIRIDEALLERAGSFQTNFRNADGSPRREKVLIDLEEVGDHLIHTVDFQI